jgi:hypothetical protein
MLCGCSGFPRVREPQSVCTSFRMLSFADYSNKESVVDTGTEAEAMSEIKE